MFSHQIWLEKDPNIDEVLGNQNMELTKELFFQKGFTTQWILGIGSIYPLVSLIASEMVCMETALSKNGVLIRLPDERWLHLTESHSEMAGYYSDVLETIEDPSAVYEGTAGEFLAARELAIDKYLVVVYKEVDNSDGFVITAFLTSKVKQLERRRKIWPQQK